MRFLNYTKQPTTSVDISICNVTTPQVPVQEQEASMEETLISRSEFSKEIQDVVKHNVDVLITICVMFGFKLEGYKPSNTYNHYFAILRYYDGNVMKMFKDKLAAFRAYYNAQELPSSPCPSNIFGAQFLFGGRAHRWMRIMQREDKDLFDSLIISLCQSKKGMTRPTKKQVHQSMVDTFRTLTGPKKIPDSAVQLRSLVWADEDEESSLNIHADATPFTCSINLRRTVRELFGHLEYTDEHRYKPFFPSSSADYNNTRSAYGIAGQIIDLIHAADEANGNDNLFKLLKSKAPLIVSASREGFRQVPLIDESLLIQQYKTLYDIALLAAETESPETKLVGLAEALKVRVISKGPAFHYFVLKPLQKFLWSNMKEHKMFRFIGKTVSAEDVQDIIGKKLSEDEYFLSVDYSDATNQIRSWASEIVISELCTVLKLDEFERKLFFESMTNHIMYPPELSKKDRLGLDLEGLGDAPLPQQNGQLMGSIVSFPILCLINATILRWTQELAYGQVMKLNNCNCTVNGDDGLLKTTKLGKEIWEKLSPYMGLKPSLGKVFFSKNFLDINSTNFTYNPEGYEGILDDKGVLQTYPILEPVQETGSPVDYYCQLTSKRTLGPYMQHITYPFPTDGRKLQGPKRLIGRSCKMLHYRATPFINAGLLFGVPRSQVKVSAKDDSSKEKSFGSVCRELISRSPEPTRILVMRKFQHVNKKFLDQAQKLGIPWYVPEDYGGLGLPIFGPFRPKELDLRLMRKFWRNRHIYKLPSRPKYSWRTWDYVAQRKKELGVSTSGVLFTEEYGVSSTEDHSVSQLEGLLAIESLFTVGRDILPASNKMKSYMPILGKFNKKLLKDQTVKLPEPFSLGEPFPVMSPERSSIVHFIGQDILLYKAFSQSFPLTRVRDFN